MTSFQQHSQLIFSYHGSHLNQSARRKDPTSLIALIAVVPKNQTMLLAGEELNSMFGCVSSPFPSIFQPHTSTIVIPSPLLGKPRHPTLHWWQQLPWAQSAPGFREQVLASQQGLLHSCKTARCSRVYKADVQDKNMPEHRNVRLTLISSRTWWVTCKQSNSSTFLIPSTCWITALHSCILCWTDWIL